MNKGLWLLAALWLWLSPVQAGGRPLLHVPEHYATIAAALAAAPDHATIQVAPGAYSESLLITRPVILRGGSGAVILTGRDDAPVIEIAGTTHVTIRGLILRGGEYGILVTRSQGIVLRNNQIEGSRIAGIKVRLGAADIFGNTIAGALPPYGKGIHVTNTMDWPKTVIRANVISGNALSGITTNMAMVTISHNIVRDNGQRGIAITEMSEAVVADNEVDSNAENGITVSDQSLAIVCNNTVARSQLPAIVGEGRYGNGITVDYYAQAELHNNIIVNNANHAISVLHSSGVNVSDNVLRGNGSDSLWTDASSGSVRNIDLPQSCD